MNDQQLNNAPSQFDSLTQTNDSTSESPLTSYDQELSPKQSDNSEPKFKRAWVIAIIIVIFLILIFGITILIVIRDTNTTQSDVVQLETFPTKTVEFPSDNSEKLRVKERLAREYLVANYGRKEYPLIAISTTFCKEMEGIEILPYPDSGNKDIVYMLLHDKLDRQEIGLEEAFSLGLMEFGSGGDEIIYHEDFIGLFCDNYIYYFSNFEQPVQNYIVLVSKESDNINEAFTEKMGLDFNRILTADDLQKKTIELHGVINFEDVWNIIWESEINETLKSYKIQGLSSWGLEIALWNHVGNSNLYDGEEEFTFAYSIELIPLTHRVNIIEDLQDGLNKFRVFSGLINPKTGELIKQSWY